MPQTLYTREEYNSIDAQLRAASRALYHAQTYFHNTVKVNGQKSHHDNPYTKDGYPYIPIEPQQALYQIETALNALSDTHHFPRFLEIGCGIAFVADMANGFGMGVSGIDIVPEYIELSQKMFSGDFFVADAFTFENYHKFDIIYAYQPMRDQDKAKDLEKIVEDAMKVGAILIWNLKVHQEIEKDSRFKQLAPSIWRKVSK